MIGDMDEQEDVAVCGDCGATIWADSDRSFMSGPDTYVCFECAERRGGVYDEDEDHWTVPPDVSGLPDERRPHL
jgi:hypothetical protein